MKHHEIIRKTTGADVPDGTLLVDANARDLNNLRMDAAHQLGSPNGARPNPNRLKVADLAVEFPEGTTGQEADAARQAIQSGLGNLAVQVLACMETNRIDGGDTTDDTYKIHFVGDGRYEGDVHLSTDLREALGSPDSNRY